MADTSTREQWEQRAEQSGAGLSGVLFRGLSESANAAIHRWHAWIVSHEFAPHLPPYASVLDLGCGYGRLTRVLRHDRPDCSVVGQDLALGYARMFTQQAGPCVCAKALQLPFSTACFDGVLAVTCLMYTQRKHVSQALYEIHRILKPGGMLLLLDPGLELQQLIARVRRNRDRSPTGGMGFGRSEYLAAARAAGYSIVGMGGNPWLSTALLVPGIRQSTRAPVTRWLSACTDRDCRPGGYLAWALHRWICAVRQ